MRFKLSFSRHSACKAWAIFMTVGLASMVLRNRIAQDMGRNRSSQVCNKLCNMRRRHRLAIRPSIAPRCSRDSITT
jgi:hypothetical protein